MSREIKFRVWDSRYSCWHSIGVPLIATSTHMVAWHEGETRFRGNPLIDAPSGIEEFLRYCRERYAVEQFTGLKDRDGCDIYEGDIVSGSDPYDTGVVKWADYGDDEYVEYLETWMVEMPFRAPLSSLIRSRYYLGRYSRGPFVGPIKIIGNVHEHPHLIPAPTP